MGAPRQEQEDALHAATERAAALLSEIAVVGRGDFFRSLRARAIQEADWRSTRLLLSVKTRATELLAPREGLRPPKHIIMPRCRLLLAAAASAAALQTPPQRAAPLKP